MVWFFWLLVWLIFPRVYISFCVMWLYNFFSLFSSSLFMPMHIIILLQLYYTYYLMYVSLNVIAQCLPVLNKGIRGSMKILLRELYTYVYTERCVICHLCFWFINLKQCSPMQIYLFSSSFFYKIPTFLKGKNINSKVNNLAWH